MTERLYYDDSYLTQFEADCEEIRSEDGRTLVRLNRTAFHPTAGGQQHDTGWIQDVAVWDVIERAGEIWHVLEKSIACGRVSGKVDWVRRFDFMQQHTGFHLLAAAFKHALHVETLSSHLGEEISTIDVALPDISEEIVQQVETRANQIIAENRPVRAFWVSPEQLAGMDLRKWPSSREKIRLVEIQDFDLDPCGGTHVRQTAEVQLVKILRWEKLRGNLRLYFLAGGRAVRHYAQLWQITRRLNQVLTSGETELLERIQDLKMEVKTQRKALQKLKTFWVEQQVTHLREKARVQNQDFVIFHFHHVDFTDVKVVAQALTKQAGLLVALFSVGDETWRLVLAAPENSTVDLRTWVEDLRAIYSVKGGGRPSWAEVIGKTNLEEVTKLLAIKMDSKE